METNEVAVIKTTHGEMILEFWPDVAPKTVENFKTLARKGFYDGTAFHRIVKGFMVQGGDPLTKDPNSESRWGTGDPGYKIKAEFNDKPHVRGVISMARSQDPDSAGSQFFICLADARFLDKAIHRFGQVDQGRRRAGQAGRHAHHPRRRRREQPSGRPRRRWRASKSCRRERKAAVIQPWRKISSRPLGDFRIFSLRADMKDPRARGASMSFL